MSAPDIKTSRRHPPARRPLRLRPVEGSARGRRRARRRRARLPRHEPPQGRRAQRRAAGSARGLADLFSLPDGYEVLLGNGGSTLFWDAAVVRPHRAAQHAPRDRRVLVEVRRGHARRTASRRSAGVRDRARRAPGAPRPRRRRRVRVPAQRDVDRRDGPVHRPDRSDALVVVDGTSAASGMRVDADRLRRLLLRAAEVLRERRRPVARAAARRARSSASSGCTRATVGYRRRSTSSIAVENSRLDQTYNTPALATIFLLDHQLQWMLANGGLEFAAGRCDTVGRHRLRLGRATRARDAVRRRRRSRAAT